MTNDLSLIRPYGFRPYCRYTPIIPYQEIIHPYYYPIWEESLDLNNIDYLLPLVAPNEVFRFVNYNGMIIKNYLVSTYGRVYSYLTNKFLSPNIGTSGYYRVCLMINEYEEKYISLHRLVMMAFYPIDNMNNLVVNHYDGNKLNPVLSNLEWTTTLGNNLHAIRTGLAPLGEDHAISKFTNEEIHHICQLLEDGLSYQKIYDIMNPSNVNYKNFTKILLGIRSGKVWKHISKYYNIPPITDHKYNHNLSYIRFLCECLKKNMSRDEICDMLNVHDSRERRNIKQTILDLIKGNVFSEIYNEYNIPTPDWYKTETELFNFTEEQVHFICTKFAEGYSYSEILDLLGFTEDNVGKYRRVRARETLYAIKNKRYYRSISDQYF